MAAPAWATDLTDIQTDPTATTNWTALGGGAAGLNAETDDYVQGGGTPSCLSKNAWTNAVKGMIYVPGGSWTIPTDGIIMAWLKYMAPPSLATKANGGMAFLVGSSASNYARYYFGGSDDLIFQTFQPIVVDPNNATADSTVGTPSGTEAAVGVEANLPTTAGPTKGSPLLIDAIRYGRHTLSYTLGDATPNGPNTFALAQATANSLANRWGNIEFRQGSYLVQGFHSIGTSGTAVYFRDSNKVIFIRASGANNLTNDAVSTGYTRFEILNASSDVEWDNITFQALGTRARGVFVHTAGAFSAFFCQFVGVDTFTLLSSSVMTDCIFRGTNAITAPGSDLRRSSVLVPTVAADAAAVIWNVATNPSGLLDDMTFSKGSAAHHAIEFGASAPTTIGLVGHSYSGFNAANEQNDSTLVFADKGSDTTWTVNISGGDTPSYKRRRGGDTVNIVASVTVTLTGLVPGTEVRVYDTSDDSAVDGVESSGTSFAFSYTTGENVYIRIFHVQYLPADILNYTIPASNTSVPVQQTFDRNYLNP